MKTLWNTFNQVPMRISRYIKNNSNSSIPCCIQFWNTLGTQVPNTRSIKTTTVNIIQFQNIIWTVKIKFLVKEMNFWNENSSFFYCNLWSFDYHFAEHFLNISSRWQMVNVIFVDTANSFINNFKFNFLVK